MLQLELLKLPIPIGMALNLLLMFWAIARAARTGELGKPVLAVLMSLILTSAQLAWVIVILVPRISP
mgnify:CR=1